MLTFAPFFNAGIKMLINIEDIAQYIELNPEEIKKDELCLKSAYNTVEKITGYELEEKEYTELQTIIDYKIILEQININEIISVTDMNTKTEIDHCVVDYKNKTVIMISPSVNLHVVLVKYSAGYTTQTLPEELKEAILKLFLYKKTQLQKTLLIEETKTEIIPQEIKEILLPYTKKRL